MNSVKKAMNESAPVRWAILFLVSFVMAANYYFYDCMSPLFDQLRMHLKFTGTDYGFLMSTYSIPNVFLFMAVIGGMILDKFGIRRTGFSFVFLMMIGSILTAYGASDYYRAGGFGHHFMSSFWTVYSPELKMMSLGFFLFGFGAETSIVVISKIIVKWFKGKQLAFAMGVNLAIARIGTGLAFTISPILVCSNWSSRILSFGKTQMPCDETYWSRPIMFASSLLIIGMLAFIVYMMYDVKVDKQIKFQNIASPEEEFKFSDIFKLIKIPAFIYITLLCVTFYSAVFPFMKYATDMMQNKFHMTRELSSNITSIIPYATAIFTPLFGLMTDKKGKSASIMILGSIMLIIVHFTFTFTSITPYLPMALLGIGFSLIPAAMWPSVAKIVDTNKIGTAYGFIFSVQNFGLWLFPMLIGYVLDKSNPGVTQDLVEKGKATFDYTNSILMLMFLGVLGLVFAILLKRDDKTSGYGLEKPNIAE
ncbi:MAG: MFS transporter [Bacteroidia bacterium]|nr:MFS transporter [Bacteroidia bacterium]